MILKQKCWGRKFNFTPVVRLAYRAGTWYADQPISLRQQIKKCFISKFGPRSLPKVVKDGPRRIVGLICPHAGYMYSGPIAAHAYQKLAADGKPDVVVLFGPNHTGYGSGLALMNEGIWRTPLGNVEIDKEIAGKILTGSNIIDVDDSAHRFEHSIEVQLPFLQYLYGADFKIVPLCFRMQDLSSAREVGQSVAQALGKTNAIIIASSDLTHFESQEQAEKRDRTVLKAVEAMDETLFNSRIETHGVSVCGYGPISALIVASKILQAKRAKLLCYKTSGDITGDYLRVVGYASMSFIK